MMRRILISFMLIFVIILQAFPVYAHKMLIESVNEETIKVIYADGSFSTRTTVTVYDEMGNEIDQGNLDSEGFFHYDTEKAHTFVASDGIGHITEWTIGEESVAKSDLHHWIMVGLVVILFISVAIFFSIKTKKKQKAA